MSPVTPPRPVDVAARFPLIVPFARPAVRLHPRPGAPTAADSSAGGPLSRPAAEPWPSCRGPHHDGWDVHEPGGPLRAEAGLLSARPDLSGANPLVPVAQLWRRDVPAWAGPAGMDLLQVLWCPLDHEDLGYLPRVALRWRRAATLGVLRDGPPPGPVLVRDDYLPAARYGVGVPDVRGRW